MRFSIRHKIAFWLFISTFLLALVTLAFQQYYTYRQFTDHLQSDAKISIRLAIDHTNKWLLDKQVQAKLLAFETEKRLVTTSDIKQDFLDLADQFGLKYAYLGLEDSTFISTDEDLMGNTGHKEKEWYQKAKKEQKPIYVLPRVDGARGKYKIAFAAPVWDELRLLIKGVVGFDTYLDELESVVGSIFISERGHLKTAPLKNGTIGIFVKEKGIMDEEFSRFINTFTSLDLKNASVLAINDNKYLVVFENLAIPGIMVIYPISLSNLMQPLITQIVWVFGICVLGLLIIFQFSLWLVSRFLKPIEELSEKTKSIASGDFKTKIKIKSNDEIGELSESFNKMTDSLVTHMSALRESVRYQERINRDIEIAADLQQKALPETIPVVEGIQIAAKSFPADMVGGDYFDFLPLDSKKMGFVIGDAAGKGFPGTIFMTNVRSVFRVISSTEKNPGTLLKKINDFICHDSRSTSGLFMTFLYGIYDPSSGEFSYANAGHYAPIVFQKKNQSFSEANISEMPLGIAPDIEYPTGTVKLSSGDIIVLYTDGVTEAKNRKKEIFGLKALINIVKKNHAHSAEEIFKKIESEIKLFVEAEPQFDDLTLLILKVI